MTISSTTNSVTYNGNGSTTGFAFSYYFLADADLTVILTDSSGVETTQTITTHYTVSGAGDAGGGTVTMITAPASGEKLTIIREPDITQSLDLVDNDPQPAEELEEALDRAIMILQRVNEKFDRAVVRLDSDTNVSLSLPVVADRASKFLFFNADGSVTATNPSDNTIADPVPVANGGTNATTAAAARTNLGLVIGTDVQAYDADTAKTDVAQSFTAPQGFTRQTDTSSAGAVTFDFAAGNDCYIDLTENITSITLSGATAGQWLTIQIQQGAGGYTVTGWPAAVKWSGGGTAPTISTTDNAMDIVSMYYDGTSYWAHVVQDHQ